MKKTLTQLAVTAGLCSLLTLVAHADDKAAAKAAAPAAATNSAAPATKPQPTPPKNKLVLDDKQKLLMQDWSKLQQEHLVTTLTNQEKLEELAIEETLDSAAVKKAAAEMAKAEEAYYLSYVEKNRALVDSLSPEQRKEFEVMRAERKQNAVKRIEKLRELQENRAAAAKSGQ